MPTAADVMTTDVEVVHPGDSIGTVLTDLSRAEFDGYPVVDDEYRVVGIVTQSDLIQIFQPSDRVFWIPIGLPPFTDVVDYAFDLSWDDLDVGVDLAKRANDPVSSVMTEEVVSVAPGDDLSTLVTLLADEQQDINRVPVVDPEGTVVGIVARQDVLGAVRDEWAGDR